MSPYYEAILRPFTEGEQAAYLERIRAHVHTDECRETREVPIVDKNGKKVTTLTQEVLHVAMCLAACGVIAEFDPHRGGLVKMCADPSCEKCQMWADVMGVPR